MADRRLDPDEASLWNAVASKIKPLEPNRRNKKDLNEKPMTASLPQTKRPAQKRTESPNKITAPPEKQKKPNADVDKRTFERLKKGKMAIEARLDLHGHTQESAHRALDAFIEAAYGAGRRCVLVITGKGLRGPEDRRGVLKQKVPQWLSSGRLSPMIVSWQPAQPRDGGEGALYILIRRRR